MIDGKRLVLGGAMGSAFRLVMLWLVQVLPAAPAAWVFYHSGLAHGVWRLHMRDEDWNLARGARAWIDAYEGKGRDG